MKFLTDLKTLIIEAIGLLGGYFWYLSNPGWEPFLLIITSAVAMLISIIMIFWSIRKLNSGILKASTQTNNTVENNGGNNVSGNKIKGNNNVISQQIITNHNDDSKIQPIRFTNITPVEIRKKINEASPYQKQSVKDSFAGHNIKWILEYKSIYPFKNDSFRITMEVPPMESILIMFDVNLNEYPILKTAGVNELFEVTGKIISIDSLWTLIELFDLVKYEA